MDPQQQKKNAEKQQVWKGADPFTLVTAVRDGLYEIPKEQREQIEGPLQELTSRFEHQQRVALGSSAISASTMSGSGAGS